MKSTRIPVATIAVALIVVTLLVCSCCLCSATALLWVTPAGRTIDPQDDYITPWQRDQDPVAQVTASPPTVAPVPDEAEETLRALEEAEIPIADLHELGIRYLGVPEDTARVVRTASPDYEVGTVRTFQVSNLDTDETFEIDARLAYKTEHVYMWMEEGLRFDQRDVEEAADLFEEHTYPTTREFFGSEWTPGVDGDPHLSILHARNLGRTVAGYFSSADSFVGAVRADSNEMEMFYIHVDRWTEIGDPFYNGVLAHEFQHMIHWNNDRNETTWLNEGCSELAMALNDRTYPEGPGRYDVGGSEYAYLDQPDTQLNTWPEVSQTGSAAPHYGASYLFMSYFLDRFGEEATKALVAHPENGLRSVDRVLADELGLDMDPTELFADWVIANLIDDPSVDEGQYSYVELDIDDPAIDVSFSRNATYPQTRRSTVHQYAVDYVEIEGQRPLELTFTGDSQVRLMDTDAYSGKYLWWSNRADESATKLTRRVDLSSATSAELSFQSWYHIEEDWDYAYVVVGTGDNGVLPSDLGSSEIRWDILDDPALSCTTTNPNNGNLGCGLTGLSSGWQRLSADLSTYAGQEIALRFEYITDAAVNQAGLAIDDIELVVDGQIILSDDVESGEGEWIAEGFVRHANVLRQAWLLQLVTFAQDGTTEVTRLLADEHLTSGAWSIPLDRDVPRAILAISALAPVTTESATYEFSLSVGP